MIMWVNMLTGISPTLRESFTAVKPLTSWPASKLSHWYIPTEKLWPIYGPTRKSGAHKRVLQTHLRYMVDFIQWTSAVYL